MKCVYYFLTLLSLSLWAACASSEPEEENDRLLAQVYNRSLYFSEVAPLVPEQGTKEDSARVINTYIDRWVKESLLMHEAEKNVPKDLDIDELVRDYRASLIRHNYEKLLVELQLDSLITEQELVDYYTTNREEYKLKQPILRCFYLKVPKIAEGWDELKEWWKDPEAENYTKLVDYCSRNATLYMLKDSSWYELDRIVQQLPKNTLSESNYGSRKEISTNDDNYRYLVRILETVPAQADAPISYVKDQITKVILHKRKIKLLDDKREEMFERESRRSNVKIYFQ